MTMAIALAVIGACRSRGLFLDAEPPVGRWEDDLIAVDVRVQQDLLAVMTITNKTSVAQVVPAPMIVDDSPYNCYELRDASGRPVKTSAVHADWYTSDRPVISIPAGRSYSEALDLRRAFPALDRGRFTLRVLYASASGDPGTWRGTASLGEIPMEIRE